jgi:hypothetical protein
MAREGPQRSDWGERQTVADAVEELVRILDRAAVLMERVLFRLKGIEVLAASDEHRFLAEASRELNEALEQLGSQEAMRAMVAGALAAALGMEPGAVTMSDVMSLADDRQRGELLRLQLRLRELHEEMDAQAQLDRDLSLARVAQIRAALERLRGAPADRYGQDGLTQSSPRGRTEFDERF